MIAYFFKLKYFLPKDVVRHVSDIDFNAFKEKGYKAVMMDVDNTLIPYDDRTIKPWHRDLKAKLETLGFKMILLSNNHPKNIKDFADELGIDLISRATKPFNRGFKKALKHLNLSKQEVLVIGDQLMTDVYGASRMGLASVLVKPIKQKSEKWYTKGFRKIEHQVKARLNTHYPDVYQKMKENHHA